MNKFIASGNLTRDPELKYSQNGKAYTRFSIAVQRPFDRENTDFFNTTCFGKTAENVASYTKKGDKLLIEGQVQMEKRDDKVYTNVIASQVEFLSTKGNTSSRQQNSNSEQNTSSHDPFQDGEPVDIQDSDLPF